MVIDLTWNVIKDMVDWVGAAHRAARGRQEQRYARVVEHAGVLVAGVNRLNNQVVALIGPLRYFDPAEWPAERRSTLVNDLILFADEGVVVPRMRTARSALRGIIVDVDDRDLAEPAGDILEMADLLFEPVDSVAGQDGVTGQLLDHMRDDSAEAERPAEYVAAKYPADSELSHALPRLIDAIRSDAAADTAWLRAAAGRLTALDDPGPRLASRETFDRLPAHSVLAPYAAGMQDAFGRLIAAQHRVFPAMPSPTWAF